MGKLILIPVLVVTGLLLALPGCTTVISDNRPRPGPAPAPSPSPGRGYKWGHGQPRLVVIEGTGIQYVADCDEDLYVLDGIWFRFSGGVWFSCRSHGGNWSVIDAPPAAFGRIPPGHAKHHKIEKKDPGPPPGRGPDKDKDKDKDNDKNPGQGKGPKWK